MEDTVNPFVTLLCTVVPCLAMLGLLGGGIAFFLNRRKAARAKSTLPSAPYPQPSVSKASPEYAGSAAAQAPAPVPYTPTPAQADPAPQTPAAAPSATLGTPSAPAPVPAAAPTPNGNSLTPSEIVLLRGEAFAPSAGMMNSWKVIGSENKVSGPPFALAAISAAFLALEQSGSVRLEDGRKKATLGLREVDTVDVIPNGSGVDWPAGSYEARIMEIAIRGISNKTPNVRDIVFHLLEEDSHVVWDWAVRIGHRGLGQRGLLDATVEKGFLKSGLTKYSMPASTAAMLTPDRVAAVQALLNEAQRQRPELMKVMHKEIKSAFGARQESADLE